MPAGGVTRVNVWLPQGLAVAVGAGGSTGIEFMVTIFELQVVDQTPLASFALK